MFLFFFFQNLSAVSVIILRFRISFFLCLSKQMRINFFSFVRFAIILHQMEFPTYVLNMHIMQSHAPFYKSFDKILAQTKEKRKNTTQKH